MLSIKLYFLNIHIYIHGIVCTLGGCCWRGIWSKKYGRRKEFKCCRWWIRKLRRCKYSKCRILNHRNFMKKRIINNDWMCWQEPDETLAERLWGLSEMFPDGVRTATEAITDFSISSTKAIYKFSCNASWIFFTSSMILFAPVLFETERAQMAELEMSQKQRVCISVDFLWNTTVMMHSTVKIIIFCEHKTNGKYVHHF